MPKKPNKNGMQEYVPAGNGDPSGEYADQSGSNTHFTSFRKPETAKNPISEPKATETPKAVEEPKQEPKKTRINELSKKQIREIGSHVFGKYDPTDEDKTKRLLHQLRYYTGNFGDLSKFTDEDLKDIMEQLNSTETTDDYVYLKQGGKWKMTKNKGIMDLAGVKTYTKEEMEQAIAQENSKLVEQSQTETDKKIQGLFGKATVCFGKGYSKDEMEEIYEASKNLTGDFPELSDYVNEIGDRASLEKYINAVNSQKVFSEEEIAEKMKKIRSMYVFGSPSDEIIRKQAIESLQGTVKFRKMNNAYAYWSGSSKSMVFMGKMKNARESLLNDYNLNFHPAPDVISVYYHEMGHGTDSMLNELFRKTRERQSDWAKTNELALIKQDYERKMNDLYIGNRNTEYKKELNEAFKGKFGIYPDDMNAGRELWDKGATVSSEISKIKKELAEKGIREYNLSQYGMTNKAEFLAESFAAHYCKANNPLGEEAFNTVMEYYKKLKEFK